MQAAILYGQEDVRVEEIPVPQPGKGELLVKIGAALTCGTDLKVYRRGYHAAMLKPPCRFGHECAGVVTEIGAGVTCFKPGDRVVAANSAPCGECFFCRKNQPNLCEDLLFLNGAYAEYIVLPSRLVGKNTHLVPESLPCEAAALTEPLACVVHGLAETAPRSGDTAVVWGLGPIGLMFVALLKHRGLKVLGIGRHAARLQAAGRLGADEVLESSDGALDRIRKLRPDVVIEATGRPEVWGQAVGLVRKGGVVNLFGGCPSGTQISLDTQRMHYDQITLKSSFHHTPDAIKEALGLIAKGVVPAGEFLSEERKLSELPELFAEMVKQKSAVKTIIRP